jgi:hypothetical protein
MSGQALRRTIVLVRVGGTGISESEHIGGIAPPLSRRNEVAPILGSDGRGPALYRPLASNWRIEPLYSLSTLRLLALGRSVVDIHHM